jgi:hypothetical protein
MNALVEVQERVVATWDILTNPEPHANRTTRMHVDGDILKA